MSFKYSAFTENTPEMREWLEGLGYENALDGVDGDILCSFNSVKRSPHYICFITVGTPNPQVVNCLGNPDLFKAVTVIRNDSDYMQWFTDGYHWERCPENKANIAAWKDYYKSRPHKATLSELQEHFKIKPK